MPPYIYPLRDYTGYLLPSFPYSPTISWRGFGAQRGLGVSAVEGLGLPALLGFWDVWGFLKLLRVQVRGIFEELRGESFDEFLF